MGEVIAFPVKNNKNNAEPVCSCPADADVERLFLDMDNTNQAAMSCMTSKADIVTMLREQIWMIENERLLLFAFTAVRDDGASCRHMFTPNGCVDISQDIEDANTVFEEACEEEQSPEPA